MTPTKKKSTNDQAILILGDGDFTFSRAFVKQNTNNAANIVATSFDTYSGVCKKYPNAKRCINEIKKTQTKIFHGIDATNLRAYSSILPEYFMYIIFNFPHTGHQRVHLNRQLLLNFFLSARDKLCKNGEVHVTLKNRPPYSNWHIEEQAKDAGFVIKERKKFDPSVFKGYNHRTTDPAAKKFEAEICTTYIFVVNRAKLFACERKRKVESDENISFREYSSDTVEKPEELLVRQIKCRKYFNTIKEASCNDLSNALSFAFQLLIHKSHR